MHVCLFSQLLKEFLFIDVPYVRYLFYDYFINSCCLLFLCYIQFMLFTNFNITNLIYYTSFVFNQFSTLYTPRTAPKERVF